MKTYNLAIQKITYGHWQVKTTYRGKEIKCTTTDSKSMDDYNSEPEERDGRELKHKRGYTILRNACIRANQH